MQEFLVESSENLTQLEQPFVELEQLPDDGGLLSNILRTIHTTRGVCRLTTPFDLIHVDRNMPDMNGLEFVAEPPQRNELNGSKVTMVTIETAIDQMQKVLGPRADEDIMKRFTNDAILDKLRLLGIVNRGK
jgi:DNA-binding response OmpR family regulator